MPNRVWNHWIVLIDCSWGGGVPPCTQVVLLYFISEIIHLLYWSWSFIIYTLTGNAFFTIWKFVVQYLLGYVCICLTCLLRLIRWLEKLCRVSFIVNYIPYSFDTRIFRLSLAIIIGQVTWGNECQQLRK